MDYCATEIEDTTQDIMCKMCILYTQVNKRIRLFPKLQENMRLIPNTRLMMKLTTPKTTTPLQKHVYVPANELCTWQVKRTRKMDKRDLSMALCLFENVVCGHHIHKEVWTSRRVACGVVEMVDIVSLKFASDEAAG